MRTIQIKPGQTNIDISLMAFGNIEQVFSLPNLSNGACITDDLEAGQILDDIPAFDTNYKREVDILNITYNNPASGNNIDNQMEGVDFWEIGGDFIVQ